MRLRDTAYRVGSCAWLQRLSWLSWVAGDLEQICLGRQRIVASMLGARGNIPRDIHARIYRGSMGERSAGLRRKGAKMARTLAMSFNWQGPMDYDQACARVRLAEEA